MKISPMLSIDFYKSGHINQYPEGTEYIYSNFTPRSSRLAMKLEGIFKEKVVFAGMQGFVQWFLIDCFNENFFDRTKTEVVDEYKWYMDNGLGINSVNCDHIAALHDLGYVPLNIKAVPEGSLVNIKVPMFTVRNTHPDFGWVTNYMEDVLSNEIWKTCTTATTAWQYRKLLEQYAESTGSNKDFVMWQAHDFSFRGLSGMHDAKSSIGHLLSFYGTDTVQAIAYLKNYYKGAETFIGGSIPASEHSVMTINGPDGEFEIIKRLITEVYPSGMVSLVLDGFDFWNTVTVVLPQLKEIILARKENALGQAKVVVRPDSGDPADIICGTKKTFTASTASPSERKGLIECLWDTFGGTINAAGYKELNPHIGAIYGDSITLERSKDILQRLKDKGFASSNIVFGVGSFTYQYQTRDSYGFAMKATWGMVKGVEKQIFKDPKTGDRSKKSAKGLLRVEKEGDDFVLYDEQTLAQEALGYLRTVFLNGTAHNFQTLAEIREVLANG